MTMLRYAITSRALYPGDDRTRQSALLSQAARWISQGIDFIQLREKDLSPADQVALIRDIMEMIHSAVSPTRLLINSRADIALAAGAHGVHLTAATDELTPLQVRTLYAALNRNPPLITISCHGLAEVHRARLSQVDAILYAPVFEKPLANGHKLPGQELDQLRAACIAAAPTPVYALGGVTLQNAPDCLKAGAGGVAGQAFAYSRISNLRLHERCGG
jgi:thiamine-phosphate pyrophosphorylase